MHGYELFCVEYFLSGTVKDYIKVIREVKNETCPDISIKNEEIWRLILENKKIRDIIKDIGVISDGASGARAHENAALNNGTTGIQNLTVLLL